MYICDFSVDGDGSNSVKVLGEKRVYEGGHAFWIGDMEGAI
jgi:hypothetical protein